MHKILIAPNAFKGTLTAQEVAQAIVAGLVVDPERETALTCVLCPLADGGDGTVKTVQLAAGGTLQTTLIAEPDGRQIALEWLRISDDEVLIELASACGLALYGKQLKPMTANTAALGSLIRSVLLDKFRPDALTINIALGGSASTDGGSGALQALGAIFFDSNGNPIQRMSGEHLLAISSCDLSSMKTLIGGSRFKLLVDVNNPLYGPEGAAHVFAPQKGAGNDQIDQLDRGLQHYADIIESACGCPGARFNPGAGAAGGTAFGLSCALEASVASGFEWVSKQCHLERKIRESTLVITGEGKLDEQSMRGKVLGEIMKMCHFLDKPLWVVAAQVENREKLASHVEIDRIIIPDRSSDICTTLDISAALRSHFHLHEFFTS